MVKVWSALMLSLLVNCASQYETIRSLPWYGIGIPDPGMNRLEAENLSLQRAKMDYMRKRRVVTLLDPASDYSSSCKYFVDNHVALCWNEYFLSEEN